jgi:hypothetical protein
MHSAHLVLSLLTLAAAGPLAAQATTIQSSAAVGRPAALPADSFDLARKYTQWFYAEQYDSLVAHHGGAARKDPALPNRLRESRAELARRAGKELWMNEERFVTRNGNRQYWRTATFTAFSEPLLIRWVMSPTGEIMGLGMGPKSDAPAIDPVQ